MRDLFALTEDPRLADLLGQFHDQRLVQGVILDHDPLWLALSELRILGIGEGQMARELTPELRNTDLALASLRRFGIAPMVLLPTAWREVLERRDRVEPLELDLDWRPSAWREYAERSGRPSDDPRRVVVALRPAAGAARFEFESSIDRSSIYLSLDVVTEVRPIPQLAAGAPSAIIGGQAIFPHSPRGAIRGTVGGVLLNRADGRPYGVTCGHVSQAGDEIYGKESLSLQSRLGTCVLSLTPPGPTVGACNPYKAGAVSGDTDIALIELDPSVGSSSAVRRVGPITRITMPVDVSQNQAAQISAASGRRDIRLGGLAEYYQLPDADGRLHCYHHLLEIKPRAGWFTAPLPGFSRMPVPGDSGGWICTAGEEGPEALAILVGTEPSAGYAGFLDFALGNLRQLGFDLGVA